MNHYKQIIVNILIEDRCDEQKINNLSKLIAECVKEQADNNINEIKEISVRVN